MLSKPQFQNPKTTKKITGQATGADWLKSTLTALGLITFLATPTFATYKVGDPLALQEGADNGEAGASASNSSAAPASVTESVEKAPLGLAEEMFKSITEKLTQHLSDDPTEAQKKATHFLTLVQNESVNLTDLLLDLTDASTSLTYDAFMAEVEAATEFAKVVTQLVSNIHDATIDPIDKKTTLPILIKILNRAYYSVLNRFGTDPEGIPLITLQVESGSPEEFDAFDKRAGLFMTFLNTPLSTTVYSDSLMATQDLKEQYATLMYLLFASAQQHLSDVVVHSQLRSELRAGLNSGEDASYEQTLLDRLLLKVPALKYFTGTAMDGVIKMIGYQIHLGQERVVKLGEVLKSVAANPEQARENGLTVESVQGKIGEYLAIQQAQEEQLASLTQKKSIFNGRAEDFFATLRALAHSRTVTLTEESKQKAEELIRQHDVAKESEIQARIAKTVFEPRADEQGRHADPMKSYKAGLETDAGDLETNPERLDEEKKLSGFFLELLSSYTASPQTGVQALRELLNLIFLEGRSEGIQATQKNAITTVSQALEVDPNAPREKGTPMLVRSTGIVSTATGLSTHQSQENAEDSDGGRNFAAPTDEKATASES